MRNYNREKMNIGIIKFSIMAEHANRENQLAESNAHESDLLLNWFKALRRIEAWNTVFALLEYKERR